MYDDDMAARKWTRPQPRWTEWPGKKGTEKALFKPRVERAWCSVATAFWLMQRVSVDMPIPGTNIGDVPRGGRMAASWDGLAMMESDLRPKVILAEHRRWECVELVRTFHVRLEAGEVHEGHPDSCDEDVCLAERVMGE